MSVLTDEINAYVHQYWLTEPGDLANLRKKNNEIAKEFPVYLYCSGHIENIATLIYDFYLRAKRCDGDLETVKSIAAEEADRFSEIFGVYYNMDDLAGFLKRSAAEYREVKSFQELEELSRILQHYLVLMSFWVDLAINWSEVNDSFHKIGYVKK
jgi:hypothetical protein